MKITTQKYQLCIQKYDIHNFQRFINLLLILIYSNTKRHHSMQIEQQPLKINFVEAASTFPTISSFLTQSQRIRLASTNKLIRQIILSSTCWPTLQIYERQHNHQKWASFFLWIFKYFKIIMPQNLIISIFSEINEQEFLTLFMNGVVQSVEKLDLYFESEDVHLGASLSFPNISDLTLRSQCASNQLVQFMFENLSKVTSLSVIKNDMNFTCANFSKYNKNAMEKLQLKPYLLNFKQIQMITKKSASTLKQLQIDVEQCQNQMIVEIITPLKNLEKLRLYHLENLNTDEQLVEIIKNTDNLQELIATKAYNFSLSRVINSFKTPSLLSLDITDSKYFKDSDLISLTDRNPNLRYLNLSWCNSLTCESLQYLIKHCLKLQSLNITGIKESKDRIFEEYLYLLDNFDEERFFDLKAQIRNRKSIIYKQNCQKQAKTKILQLEDLINVQQFIFKRSLENDRSKLSSLRNLKILDCRSCNGISDQILQCIYLVNRKVKAYNYYGNQMSVLNQNTQQDF